MIALCPCSTADALLCGSALLYGSVFLYGSTVLYGFAILYGFASLYGPPYSTVPLYCVYLFHSVVSCVVKVVCIYLYVSEWFLGVSAGRWFCFSKLIPFGDADQIFRWKYSLLLCFRV